MRHNVKIIGIDKNRIQGEKNGYSYDFLLHHGIYSAPDVSGFRPISFGFTNEDVVEYGYLEIGKSYDMVFHFGKNHRLIIDSILGVVEDSK